MQGRLEARKGVLAIVGACLIWGFAPLYYHAFPEVRAPEMMAHRTIWTCVALGLVVLLTRRWGEVRVLMTGAERRVIVLAAGLIGFNWFLFIWAVSVHRAVEASLGYYILPLVSAAVGFVVLRERLRPAQVLAIGMAVLAVGVLTIGLGVAPYVALALAVSFSLYSLVKRRLRAAALISVLVEVLIIGVPALILLLWAGGQGGDWGWFGRDLWHTVMLPLAGPISGVPLILFSYGAQRVRLATSGLAAYLNPTIQFLSAALVMGEAVTPWHGVALLLIWAAIAVYSVAGLRAEKVAVSAAVSSGTPPTVV